ncbi:hypothetical protein [Vibrio parahaemolyticus]|uniref:hypothetical protein n=1 Tax=Vibrio parahaemolyticus TaxID=670 RepID=UPI002B3E8FAF|nr:hypothetical protein [Vibrio harveyi]
MNIEILRNQYGFVQITLPAMTGREFKYFMDSLDNARYPEENARDFHQQEVVTK